MAAFYCQVLGGLAPPIAEAKVDPLNRITRQIHKPNMLVVLDTSGSLTGVPGGTFDFSDEVGVDCDNGANCRGGLSAGTCRASAKVCYSDVQCAKSTCQKGAADCATDSDCQPISGKCSTGEACYIDNDCPPLSTGTCANSGTSCSTGTRCTARLRCKYNSSQVCSTNSDCKPGLCGTTTSSCTTDSDCPYAVTGGACAFGTTPSGGCASAADCPVRAKVCSDNPNKTCATVNDCGGLCVKGLTACTSSANCTAKTGDSCSFSGKTCASPANSCLLPRVTCNQTYTDNVCKDINPCVYNVNPCTGAAVNHCLPGAVADVCNAGSSSTGSRMCRITNEKCDSDSDCSASGDSCGPASSRFVIAKRVIRNMVAANAAIVNLGLMTFYQSGYFPYYPVTSTSTTSNTSTDIKAGTLSSNGCYTKKTGLTSTCTVSHKSYSLRAGNNAKYLIKGHGGKQDRYVDAPYCGWFCDIAGVGTGTFTAAYYDYTDVQGTLGAKMVLSSYQGKVFTDSHGVTYRYYDARPDYYNGGAAPPIDTVNCGSTCSSTCGARWDTQLAPFLNSDDTQTNFDSIINAFNQALEPASYGGLISFNGTPSGCALENNVAADRSHSAYHYMQDVKAADPLPCRQNFVLFVTDGEANGPGDSNCTAAACSAADPQAAGCTCRAVLAAWHMNKNLGVKTFVVGFSTDAATGTGHVVNDNIAKAGGTDVGGDGTAPYAFGATNESELNDAIQGAIFQAIQGSYSTAPATASQGVIQGTSEQSGNILLDSRIDFPSWKGHLVAYDVSSGMPVLVWDAATRLGNMDWKTRRIYTRDASGSLLQVQIDPTSGAIGNKATLNGLGLGDSPDEAEQMMRWLLGDPALKNPATLGSIINSTPIDVGPPADGTAKGAHDFFLQNQSRPSVTYVGSDDGMLHAFYTRDTTVNGVLQRGGREAFAYLPRSMLPTVAKLYAQGGQVPDPKQHIYGLASSPKVKSVCTRYCDDSSPQPAEWKTTLVMTEGWGGNGVFVLDITNPAPIDGSTPFKLLWSAASTNQSGSYGNDLGFSVSVPAFTFVPGSGMSDQRVIMGSGYPIDDSATTEGRVLLSASVQDGTIKTEKTISPSGPACAQQYAILTDVATARKQGKDGSGIANGIKTLVSAYFGDTWGNLWQYSAAADATSLLSGFGCQQPLHFSPTVVQLDQDDPSNTYAGQIFLIQVTNSSLDAETDAFPPSKMVIIKESFNDSGLTVDTSFGDNGKLEIAAPNLCAVSNAAGACTTALPSNARPLATPTAIIKPDGTGFVVLSNWYAPPGNGCGKGATYFQMHDFSGSTVTLKQAMKIADEPVVNPIIVNGNLMISSSNGPVNVSNSTSLKVISAKLPVHNNVGDPFQMTSWTEVE
jgi:hypothetical protein